MIMRPSLLLPACVLGLVAGASAQSLPDTAPIATVQVTPAAGTYRLRNEQAQQISGLYDMSNGWSVDVRADGRYADVTIDGDRPMRLLAVSSRKLVSGDGDVTLEFSRGNADSDMVMRYRPAPGRGLAEIVVSSAPVAQR
jgi:hypothetical protein